MRDRLRRRLALLARDSESGAAMVEFVLVFPLQLFLTLMILQFAFVAHAHIVVQQAAFMGARAAAVADGMTSAAATQAGQDPGINPREAALRVAARTCAVLCPDDIPLSGGAGLGVAPALTNVPTALAWSSEAGGRGFLGNRQAEAYGLINLMIYAQGDYPNGGGAVSDGARVGVDMTFDYPLMIPVARHIFAKTQIMMMGNSTYNAASLQRGYTVFRIRRAAYVPTPWNVHPNQSQSTAVNQAVAGPQPPPGPGPGP